jgi:hypothetical protein
MPASGSIETAPQFGFIDSAIFSSASALHAHTLRTIATNGNTMVTQVQPVFRALYRASQATSSGNPGSRTLGMLSVPLFNFWQTVQAPTVCPKQPGVRELDVRCRVMLTSGSVALLQLTTMGSQFQEQPNTEACVMAMTGTGDWQLVSGTVRCRREDEETIAVYVRGRADHATDSLAPELGDEGDAIVSSSFDPGSANSPGRFLPTLGSSALGFDNTGKSPINTNKGRYVMFYRPGTLEEVHGPVAIVSQSVDDRDGGRLAMHFLPPATVNLVGLRYRVFAAPVMSVASLAAFTRARTA